MIKPFAPRTLRGFSWVCLLVVLALGDSPSARAQQPGKPAEPAKKPDPAAKPAAPPEPKPEEEETEEKDSTVEILKDPQAEEVLPIEKLKSAGYRNASNADIKSIRSMATGQQNVDGDTILRVVQGVANKLTDKGAVEAWLDPTKNSTRTLEIHKATDVLLEGMNYARSSQNAQFLKSYNDALLATMPKLLSNHLLPRTEAIILLAQAAPVEAVPIFLKELKDPKQTLWVKLWSAQGLTNVAGGGKQVDRTLPGKGAMDAGKALADFLNAQKDVPWPVAWRTLEAIGSMRQAATTSSPQKAEMANVAMAYLADPEANPRVRATAAWALGMVRVNTQTQGYNFGLVGYEIGDLVAECGDQVVETFQPNNRSSTEHYTGLLVKELYESLNGNDQIRDSGLAKTGGQLGTSAPVIRQLADMETAIARASVMLVRSPNGLADKAKADVKARVAELKVFLEKNKPKDFKLVPGGPEFPPKAVVVKKDAAPKKDDDKKPPVALEKKNNAAGANKN